MCRQEAHGWASSASSSRTAKRDHGSRRSRSTPVRPLLDGLGDRVGEVLADRALAQAPALGDRHRGGLAQLGAQVPLAQPGGLAVPVEDAQPFTAARQHEDVVEFALPVDRVDDSVARPGEGVGDPGAVGPFGLFARGLRGPAGGRARPNVFDDVAPVASQLAGLQGDPAAYAGQSRLDPAEVGVALVLGEAASHHGPGPGVGLFGEEADDGVVGGEEGRQERLDLPGSERGQLVGVGLGRADDDRVPDVVFASPSRPAD